MPNESQGYGWDFTIPLNPWPQTPDGDDALVEVTTSDGVNIADPATPSVPGQPHMVTIEADFDPGTYPYTAAWGPTVGATNQAAVAGSATGTFVVPAPPAPAPPPAPRKKSKR